MIHRGGSRADEKHGYKDEIADAANHTEPAFKSFL
jgi:hypothetical protein